MAMTPLQINTAARQRYNAVDDDFWTDAEIYNTIYQGCCELATAGLIIEAVYTASSVASQQAYTYPTNAMNIKRITYTGRKLVPTTMREDDILTQLNSATTSTGTPSSYFIWADSIYLRPIPVSAITDTIKVWSNIEPGSVTATSTLEIPTEFQMALVNLILSEMSAKNKNYEGANYYRQLWAADVIRAKDLQRRKKRGDGFALVQNVDMIPQSDLGNV